MGMSKELKKIYRNRMIHVRLDEDTHRRLKVRAAQGGTTIQQVVESLIRQKVVTPKSKSGIE
jgi:plasmid stability protein